METLKKILKKIGKFFYMLFKILFAIVGFASIVLLIMWLVNPDMWSHLIIMIFVA